MTDINGCSHFLDFEIIESTELQFTINGCTDTISCYGDSSAFISLNALGGTPPYIFDLYNSDSLFSQQSFNLFNNLPANNYEVFIIDSYGCKDSLEIIRLIKIHYFKLQKILIYIKIFCVTEIVLV